MTGCLARSEKSVGVLPGDMTKQADGVVFRFWSMSVIENVLGIETAGLCGVARGSEPAWRDRNIKWSLWDVQLACRWCRCPCKREAFVSGGGGALRHARPPH